MSTGDSSNGRSVGPHVGASGGRDPSKNARRHGAYSKSEIARLMPDHLARLRLRFPEADDGVLFIQAERAAQLDLIREFLQAKGGVKSVFRNQRNAEIWPVADYVVKVQSAYERAIERLEQQASVRGGRGVPTLADIQAEYADGET